MSAPIPSLSDCAAGMALSPLPVWVVDPDTMHICWANDAALTLWRAERREELYARDVMTGAPEIVIARLRHALARVLAGEHICEEWSFYPRGEPTPVLLYLRKISLPGGADGMLNQVAPLEVDTSPAVLRALAAMRHLSTPVAFVSEAGELRMQNPAAMAEFGETTTWTSWFVDVEQGRRILAAAHGGEDVRAEAKVIGLRGERCHAIEAHALRDPILGDLGILVLHRDETARLAAEQTASARLLLVEAQRREILSLSAPILSVGAHTLAVPIIGRLDEERSREIMERLLAAVVEQKTRRVILDLTGVAEMDEASAQRLSALFAAVRMLGSAAVLTGLRPELAGRLAQSDFDRRHLRVVRSLAEALER